MGLSQSTVKEGDMVVVYQIITWASLLIPYFVTVGHYVPLLLSGIVFLAYWFAFAHFPVFMYIHAGVMIWSLYETFRYFPIWMFAICLVLTIFFIGNIVHDLLIGFRPL